MKKLLKLIIVLGLMTGAGILGWRVGLRSEKKAVLTAKMTPEPTPFLKYQVQEMINNRVPAGRIELSLKTKTERGFDTYLIKFWHEPEMNKVLRQTSGVVNIPIEQGGYPIVLMARGYVDQETYETGMGTKNASEYFSSNGYITIAPDFLGYATSDSESSNIFETRFQTYVTFSSLIEAIYSDDRSKISEEIFEKWDKKNVFIWAHSNGGQITLTSLAATGRAIPATLWAPVSKPFPYSILYFTDESDDRGKYIRAELSQFEKIYDVEAYNFDYFMSRIKGPIQIHQGTADDAVPMEWSNELSQLLKINNISYNYYIYTGADHNMRPDWNTVVSRDLDFFSKNMLK